MSSTSNHVVKVRINATVAGKRLGVQEATIALGVNAIPSITLVCAPTQGSMTPLKPDVQATSITDYLVLYAELQKKAEGLDETGSVTISTTDSGTLSGETIQLKDWILAEAGLSGFSATQAPLLFVTLKHPICKLTKFGSIYETPKVLMDREWNAAATGNNPIDLCGSIYNYVANKVQYWPATNQLASQFRSKLGEAEFQPKKYLDWSGTNGIMFNVADGRSQVKRLREAIARLLIPSDGGTSTWDMLQSLCGQILTSIVQEEGHSYLDDKLLMEPTRPWKTSQMTLADYWCNGLSMPCMDPFRLSGVMARKLAAYSDMVQFAIFKMANMNAQPPTSDAFYAPKGLNPDKADGRIMKVEVPKVLCSAFRRDAPRGGSIPGMVVFSEATRKDHYNTLVERYCQAVYEISACQMVYATAEMALRFHDPDDNLLVPGQTAKFEVGADNPILYGYVRQIVHHMSTRGGCGTTVRMSHVRNTPDYQIDGQTVIAEDAPNVVYE